MLENRSADICRSSVSTDGSASGPKRSFSPNLTAVAKCAIGHGPVPPPRFAASQLAEGAGLGTGKPCVHSFPELRMVDHGRSGDLDGGIRHCPGLSVAEGPIHPPDSGTLRSKSLLRRRNRRAGSDGGRNPRRHELRALSNRHA